MEKQLRNKDSDHMQPREGRGRAFGTFGELLQGVHADNDLDFLVTFPIDRFAHASFVAEPESRTITVFPSYKQKARRLVTMILEHYEYAGGGHLAIDSDIPVGKGLASSSADLVATSRAISDFLGVEIPEKLLHSFLRAIEPTDGVMYPGVVSFYHRQVELREFLGPLPLLTVISIDEGGEVDTLEFNKLPKPFTQEEKREYRHLLNVVSEAIREQDVFRIGQVATRSAQLNQKLRPKRTLEQLIEVCEEVGGLGVLVAHSGTCIGILLTPTDPRYEEQIKLTRQRLEPLTGAVMIYHSWSEQRDVQASDVPLKRASM